MRSAIAIENKALRGPVLEGVILHPLDSPKTLADTSVSLNTSRPPGIGHISRHRDAEGF